MLRPTELLDELVDYAELVEGVAALMELANDWRCMEQTVRRRGAKLARLALKLRRERGASSTAIGGAPSGWPGSAGDNYSAGRRRCTKRLR
jgi:hypothetical protein